MLGRIGGLSGNLQVCRHPVEYYMTLLLRVHLQMSGLQTCLRHFLMAQVLEEASFRTLHILAKNEAILTCTISLCDQIE